VIKTKNINAAYNCTQVKSEKKIFICTKLMSRRSNPFEEMFKSFTGENGTNDRQSFFRTLSNNEYVQNLKKISVSGYSDWFYDSTFNNFRYSYGNT
jgi:hypothetical protein